MVNFEQAVGATPATISVSGLVDYIKATLEDDPNPASGLGGRRSFQRQTITLKGLFFTLTDLEDNAAINCVGLAQPNWPSSPPYPRGGGGRGAGYHSRHCQGVPPAAAATS